MTEKGLTQHAFEFAAYKHNGQKRKWTKEPYINHPLHVKELLQKIAKIDDEIVLAAALLHDVIEDTDATYYDLLQFDEQVAELVYFLTDPPSKGRDNRAIRKMLTRFRLGAAPVEAQLIKCADILSNAPGIRDNDPKFWEKYREECIMLMECFCDPVQQTQLFNMAWTTLSANVIAIKGGKK